MATSIRGSRRELRQAPDLSLSASPRLLNVAAAMIVFAHWQAGLVLSAGLVAWLLLPPETPRYVTEAPIIEGEA